MAAPQALYVPLPQEAASALRNLARREYRHPREQAVVLVLDGLRRAGALAPSPQTPSVAAAEGRQ